MVEQMAPHAVKALMQGQTPYALIDVRRRCVNHHEKGDRTCSCCLVEP
jgi:hypothetical protein